MSASSSTSTAPLRLNFATPEARWRATSVAYCFSLKATDRNIQKKSQLIFSMYIALACVGMGSMFMGAFLGDHRVTAYGGSIVALAFWGILSTIKTCMKFQEGMGPLIKEAQRFSTPEGLEVVRSAIFSKLPRKKYPIKLLRAGFVTYLIFLQLRRFMKEYCEMTNNNGVLNDLRQRWEAFLPELENDFPKLSRSDSDSRPAAVENRGE